MSDEEILSDGAPEVVDDQPDELIMLKSGRVRFRWEGQTWTLRRPRFGELREYRVRLAESSEDAVKARTDPDISPRDRVDASYKDLFDLLEWAFATLGDKRLPDNRDDLPPWLASQSLPAQLIGHWQSVPLGSGES